jgi:hypothetical protein
VAGLGLNLRHRGEIEAENCETYEPEANDVGHDRPPKVVKFLRQERNIIL